MSTQPSCESNFDRESFQKLLANAYAVQESHVDSQSLAAVVELQRSITRDDLDLDGMLDLIASRALQVAGASGVAVGVLEGNQLVYLAGAGSAAVYIGQRVAATLSVSGDTGTSREILRVEDADTDARIEADICRQFGARSLLILLIPHQRGAAGVLEVLFAEPHTFQEPEVRAYRLMAALVAEAISKAEAERESLSANLSNVLTIGQSISQVRQLAEDSDPAPASATGIRVRQLWHDVIDTAAERLVSWQRLGTDATVKILKRIPARNFRWNLAAAVATVLLMVVWVAHSSRRTPSSFSGPASQQPNAADPVPFASERPNPAKPVSFSPSASRLMVQGKLPSSAFRRVQVGKYEVDDVTDDVTVRHFTNRPTPEPARLGYRQVDIGNDVTVRYFASQSAGTRSLPKGLAPADRSKSTPDNSGATAAR